MSGHASGTLCRCVLPLRFRAPATPLECAGEAKEAISFFATLIHPVSGFVLYIGHTRLALLRIDSFASFDLNGLCFGMRAIAQPSMEHIT